MGMSTITLVAFRLLPSLTRKLRCHLVTSAGAQRVTSWRSSRWCEKNRNAPVIAFRYFQTVAARISRYLGHNGGDSQNLCAAYQTTRRRVHPLRLDSCSYLVNVLDAGPTSPREEHLSDDERDPSEPTRTEAYASDKSVSHNAAR
jgi:hypothetical protein